MKILQTLTGAALTVGLLAWSSSAQAGFAGETIHGTLNFAGGGTNYFNPANGHVPAGYGNSLSDLATVTPGQTTFGFYVTQPTGYDNVLASFASTAGGVTYLDVEANVVDNAFGMDPWLMTFTSDKLGLFTKLSLESAFYTGLYWSLAGDTITVGWKGFDRGAPDGFSPRFVVDERPITPPDGVPEPAAWAMMLTGFALVGATLRSRRADRLFEWAPSAPADLNTSCEPARWRTSALAGGQVTEAQVASPPVADQ